MSKMMSTPQSALQGTISVSPAGASRPFIYVFSTRCPVCGEHCLGQGQFMAVGSPNHVLLHAACAPLYSFPPQWPHNHPAVAYGSGLAGQL